MLLYTHATLTLCDGLEASEGRHRHRDRSWARAEANRVRC
jgi:hypothetical protein